MLRSGLHQWLRLGTAEALSWAVGADLKLTPYRLNFDQGLSPARIAYLLQPELHRSCLSILKANKLLLTSTIEQNPPCPFFNGRTITPDIGRTLFLRRRPAWPLTPSASG